MKGNNFINEFLVSFFSLFKAKVVESSLEGDYVKGNISWQDDEDQQAFNWHVQFEDRTIQEITRVCDLLILDGLIRGDRIIITPSEMKKWLCKYGWEEFEAENLITNLCSIRIRMVDDGEETDTFLVHF